MVVIDLIYRTSYPVWLTSTFHHCIICHRLTLALTYIYTHTFLHREKAITTPLACSW